MNTVPTDSVLRRHYEQMREAARSGAGSGPAPRAPESTVRSGSPPPASHPAPTPEPATGHSPPAPAATDQGGFFGWLKRLFGG